MRPCSRWKLPRWLLLSLLHPLASALLLVIGIVSTGGKPWGVIGYIASLLVFVINLPGVLILQQWGPVAASSVGDQAQVVATVSAIMLLTWLLLTVPLCWLGASVLRRWRRGKRLGA